MRVVLNHRSIDTRSMVAEPSAAPTEFISVEPRIDHYAAPGNRKEKRSRDRSV